MFLRLFGTSPAVHEHPARVPNGYGGRLAGPTEVGIANRRPGVATDFREFLAGAEEGVQPIEVLLIIFFLMPPIYYSFEALLAILKEFLAFEAAVLTSPFF